MLDLKNHTFKQTFKNENLINYHNLNFSQLVMFYPSNALSWTTNSYGIYTNNADLGGQDLSNSIQSTFTNCLATCASTAACTHLSYGYSNTNWWTPGSCWLKYGPRTQSTVSSLAGVQTAILNQSNIFKKISNFWINNY